MSSILAQIQAAAAQAASTGVNMTEVVAGGQGSRLLPEGYALSRIVEYIEFGSQPQEYKGVAKAPAPSFQLGIALYGKNMQGEMFENEDGTPYIIRPYDIAISQNDKSRAFLLFKLLNWRNLHTHFAQFVGEPFLTKIVTKPASADGKSKAKSIVDLKAFLPAIDQMTGQPYPVPPVRDEDLKLFLWDYPNLEAWNSFFIDGSWEAKDGQPARSKNFIQEKLLSATDFSGSALESLLVSTGKPFTIPAKVAKPVAAAPAGPGPAAPPVAAAPAVAPNVVAQPAAAPPAVVVTPPAPVVMSPPIVVPASVPAAAAAVSPSIVLPPPVVVAPALPPVVQ